MRELMRDMADSSATISVALCYVIHSRTAMRGIDAKTRVWCEKSRGPRLALGPAHHGAARPVGPALELADPVGAAHAAADVARAAHRLRRGLAHRVAGAAVRVARGGLRRPGRSRRLQPDAARAGIVGKRPAAAPIRRAMAQADGIGHADATVRLA